ncbi:heavy metal translocating P-type ATPase metal-binding domain-containing protein [Pararhodospirillum oryzae]|uniref:Copper-translocating P-type ATPase n=1 Tax=Pararhodospirillum oryzae TaxID=478448 RepID=A0A512H6J7_9PROT|nr:heavy metal translocating P-type ATPase metal-binding domain-containing protein [Pararhodospirillum oryzae]GEO81061.1 copper-translocating P-type ATPase [Pararhodospirillum oryzae]
MNEETQAVCRHCGQPVAAPGMDPGEAFCCPGCRAAHALVMDCGLGAYYERRCLDPALPPPIPEADDPLGLEAHVRLESGPGGTVEAVVPLVVEGLHCAACVWLIEHVLARNPTVCEARVNMTTRRLIVRFVPTPAGPDEAARALARGSDLGASAVLAPVRRLGYRLVPLDPEAMERAEARAEKVLVRALAVAGFAAGNVMLLSVSVWAGLDMEPATRDLLHWISALIAVPAVAYAIGPFARPALGGLRAGRITMDLPITLAVLIATGVSLAETIQGGAHAYFDAAVMLLFFLLLGRVLEARARGRARAVAARWLTLSARAVSVQDADGRVRQVAPARVAVGERVLVAAGERLGVDGRVETGRSSVDASLLSGESLPRAVGPGDPVFAGTLNHDAPLVLTVTASGEATVLADIVRLMENAQQGRSRYVALADRVARLYGPAVHLLALAAFLGWWGLGGMAPDRALMIAAAVLIVTCPCALALAVPAVGVVACGALMRRGVLVRSPTALERLAEVDTVVFDKTGTLTRGTVALNPPAARGPAAWTPADLARAGRLAAASRHPLARALARAAGDPAPPRGVREVPGQGLALGETRLGSLAFCRDGAAPGVFPPENSGPALEEKAGEEAAGPMVWFARPGLPVICFSFVDEVRPQAPAAVAGLRALGLEIHLLSGDRPAAVAAVAGTCGIEDWTAGISPRDKTDHLEALARSGRRVLMVGDGLNDAPALAAAHASISPTSAVDLTRGVADADIESDRLDALPGAVRLARRAQRLVRQNLALALGYNVVMIPLALAGWVTPLVAAVAMSASSLVVTLNAVRGGGRRSL